ncbi:MAG: MGMT family protein [Saprospiraceae bacterium]|nr:MGMT family protein [Saprospiraceae bacterium]
MKKPKPPGHWRRKLEKHEPPRIEEAPKDWAERYGGHKMLIANALLVDEKLRQVPKGRLITIGRLREQLAADFNADFACPLTTGIFARIAAETAEEDRAQGRTEVTPWWRLVRDDGSLNEKLPGGGPLQAAYLNGEGIQFEPKGKKNVRVIGFAGLMV